jgi:hypothetical protein
MKVNLGPLAREAIESRLGTDVSAGVQAALLHYARRVRSGQKPVPYPGFLEGSSTEAGGELDISVDPEVEQVLTDEMRRQGLSLDQVAAHAVFVYLADLD